MAIRSNAETTVQKKPTFIEEARRRQIIAIETIATQGLSQTSLAEIVRGAGISEGVISYHFAGKEDLIDEILRSLLRRPAEFIKERVCHHKTALEKLRAYIESNFNFMEAHRNNYVALVNLWGRRSDSMGHTLLNAEAYELSRHDLARILEEGRECGELRPLLVQTTASLLQAVIDGVMLQWVFDENAVDLDVYRAELVAMTTHHVIGEMS